METLPDSEMSHVAQMSSQKQAKTVQRVDRLEEIEFQQSAKVELLQERGHEGQKNVLSTSVFIRPNLVRAETDNPSWRRQRAAGRCRRVDSLRRKLGRQSRPKCSVGASSRHLGSSLTP